VACTGVPASTLATTPAPDQWIGVTVCHNHVVQVVAHASASVSGWTILESIGTVISAAILVLTAVVASRYGHRADPLVSAHPFGDEGTPGLSVRTEIASRGIRRLRIAREDGHSPTITVVEVLVIGEKFEDGRRWSAPALDGGSHVVVDPGETISGVVVFPVGPLRGATVGWRVKFNFEARRWRGFGWLPWVEPFWWWETETYAAWSSRPLD
jgi:hypothetical protein